MARQHNIQVPGQAQRAPVAHDQQEQGAVALTGLGDASVVIDIDGRSVPLNDIIESAFETSALSLLEWNALEGAQRDGLIAQKRAELAQMYRNAGDLPDQEAARAAAQAAVARRQAAREAQPDVPANQRTSGLPHRDDVNPKEIAAPVLTQQGWVVHHPKPIPHNFK